MEVTDDTNYDNGKIIFTKYTYAIQTFNQGLAPKLTQTPNTPNCPKKTNTRNPYNPNDSVFKIYVLTKTRINHSG